MKLKAFAQQFTRELTIKRKHEPGYFAAMSALKEVRDTHAYFPKYESFEEFCRQFNDGDGYTMALTVKLLEDLNEI
jgi:hypothetical protein